MASRRYTAKTTLGTNIINIGGRLDNAEKRLIPNQIAPGSIEGNLLKSASIAGTAIADSTITATNIQDGAVSATKIDAGAVTSSALAKDSVDVSKFGNTVTGTLPGANGGLASVISKGRSGVVRYDHVNNIFEALPLSAQDLSGGITSDKLDPGAILPSRISGFRGLPNDTMTSGIAIDYSVTVQSSVNTDPTLQLFQHRNVWIDTVEPVSTDGNDGDIWIVYV